jgi:hypothetical protein
MPVMDVSPPLLILPIYPTPLLPCPICDPCEPGPLIPDVPTTRVVPDIVIPTTPPKIQEVNPTKPSQNPERKIEKEATPAPSQREATPRPAVPPPEPLDAPRPKDKTSDGLPIPQPNLPTKPPADDPQFPPLKLNPPPDNESSVSFARPESRLKADIYPIEATHATSQLMVGFHNRTDDPVTITLLGETMKLPSRHSISAIVPRNFQWRLDGGTEQSIEVPVGSAGVEIVIR